MLKTFLRMIWNTLETSLALLKAYQKIIFPSNEALNRFLLLFH